MSVNEEIAFAGARLLLDASGALYWPDQHLLAVSDLHLEKSTYLAQHGSFVAPYDTQDTLDRLDSLIGRYQPRELIFLGDSFHDRHAWSRLDGPLSERIERLCRQVERCCWIEGNHDAGMHQQLNFIGSRDIQGFQFRHEYKKGPAAQIIGHYHPKVSVLVKGRALSGRCFVVTPQLLIMPAFGSYTGGLDISHEAIRSLFKGQPVQCHLLYRNHIRALKVAE